MTKSIICSIPSIIFLMISVNVHKETKAVCFFNFTKRPIVDDVKKYNLAISNLWRSMMDRPITTFGSTWKFSVRIGKCQLQ